MATPGKAPGYGADAGAGGVVPQRQSVSFAEGVCTCGSACCGACSRSDCFTLQPGDRIAIAQELESSSGSRTKLTVGEGGTVVRVDEHGDVLIDFVSHPKLQWVAKANLGKLVRKKARAPPQPGDIVMVAQSMFSSSADSVRLSAGLQGKIVRVDSGGDALVDFPAFPSLQWVSRNNCAKLTKSAGGSPTAAAGHLAAPDPSAEQAPEAPRSSDIMQAVREAQSSLERQAAVLEEVRDAVRVLRASIPGGEVADLRQGSKHRPAGESGGHDAIVEPLVAAMEACRADLQSSSAQSRQLIEALRTHQNEEVLALDGCKRELRNAHAQSDLLLEALRARQAGEVAALDSCKEELRSVTTQSSLLLEALRTRQVDEAGAADSWKADLRSLTSQSAELLEALRDQKRAEATAAPTPLASSELQGLSEAVRACREEIGGMRAALTTSQQPERPSGTGANTSGVSLALIFEAIRDFKAELGSVHAAVGLGTRAVLARVEGIQAAWEEKQEKQEKQDRPQHGQVDLTPILEAVRDVRAAQQESELSRLDFPSLLAAVQQVCMDVGDVLTVVQDLRKDGGLEVNLTPILDVLQGGTVRVDLTAVTDVLANLEQDPDAEPAKRLKRETMKDASPNHLAAAQKGEAIKDNGPPPVDLKQVLEAVAGVQAAVGAAGARLERVVRETREVAPSPALLNPVIQAVRESKANLNLKEDILEAIKEMKAAPDAAAILAAIRERKVDHAEVLMAMRPETEIKETHSNRSSFVDSRETQEF